MRFCVWRTREGNRVRRVYGTHRSTREDMVRPLRETDVSYRAAETHQMCAHGWSGIQRITADKQYCKYQPCVHTQHSGDVRFRCIVRAFFFFRFQCFNPLSHQQQYVPLGFMCITYV